MTFSVRREGGNGRSWIAWTGGLLGRGVPGGVGPSRRLAHGTDGSGQKVRALEGAFDADGVAYLDVGKGDGVAALAESGVLVGDEGMGGVVDDAHEGDFDA